jgi:riboflavin-specific deaminase-like protein
MDRAHVTDAVWNRLLRARTNGAADPLPGWSAAERAAWALYVPIARAEAPFLFAQVGQSLDGRIATPAGDARDISGRDGLAHLHRCRALASAVVIGVKTALHDDPQLTVRLVSGPNPARVVIDPQGRLPDEARVLNPDGARRIVIQSTDTARPEGVEVVRLPAVEGWISPHAIARALSGRGLARVLVEGGGVTIAKFLEARLLGRLHISVAPLIIGAGPAGLRTTPVARLTDALRPETHVYGLDTDVVFDCVLDQAGSASTSRWPTVQDEAPAVARRL